MHPPGAVIEAPTPALLAARLNVPQPELAQSFAEIEEARRTGAPDRASAGASSEPRHWRRPSKPSK
jgi:hypothetical protein